MIARILCFLEIVRCAFKLQTRAEGIKEGVFVAHLSIRAVGGHLFKQGCMDSLRGEKEK